LGLALVLALTTPAVARAAAPKFTETSDYGLIVLEIEPGGDIAAANGGFALRLGSFSPEDQVIKIGSFSPPPTIGVSSQGSPPPYYMAKAKPGIYAIQGLAIRNWGVCFNGDSRSFEVKPGQVTSVGRLAPAENLDALGAAVRSGQLAGSARQGDVLYLFDTPRLALTPAAEIAAWQANLQAWLDTGGGRIAAPVVAAELRTTHFNTGRDALGLKRICGGYYAKRASTPEGQPKAEDR
jgi:hypothetical protein